MLIETENLRPNTLGASVNLQTYCGLDCCLTLEIYEQLLLLPQSSEPIYSFERALQGPYLEIMQRGFSVDDLGRREASHSLRQRLVACQEVLNEFAFAVWGRPLNPASPQQLKDFFYRALRMPEVFLSFKGERRLSTNREALEKLDQYLYARPFVNLILRMRDLKKQLEFFEVEIDPDGRFRSSYNIAGTETGRPSSSENAFGTGRNAQNIAAALRYVLQADKGKKLCVIDLEQVEARDVGFFCGCLFDDWDFLDACESGDLHTNNCIRIWPELPWTASAAENKKIAQREFYREFSYRDMAKRGGHLTNYFGTAWTASRALKVPVEVMENFQARYCRGGPGIVPAFPAIPKYWQWVAQQLQTKGELTNPFGRRRHFFGRPNDDTTLREAIAFLPQSTTAERMNLGLWRVWRHEERAELLAQTYDSITFQYNERCDEQELIPRVLELIKVELRSPSGRSYIVPGEAKIGWNWGNQVLPEEVEKAVKKGRRPPRLNIDGLAKWSPSKLDLRRRTIGLSRVMFG